MQSWKEEREVYSLLIIAIAFTILDIYTNSILHQKGFIEGNPIMRYVLLNLGIAGFLLINIVLSISLLGFLIWGSIEKLEGECRYPPIGVYCVGRGIFVRNDLLLFVS